MHVVPRRYAGVDETLGVSSMTGDAIGLAAKGVGKVGAFIGTATAGLALGTAGLVGKAAFAAVPPAVKFAGNAAWGTAGFLAKGYGPLGSPIKAAAEIVGKVGKNMVTYEGSHMQYNRYLGKLEKKGPSLHISKFGAGVLGGLAAVQGARSGMNAYMESRMGTVDTKTTSLTPDYSPQEYRVQHPDFAGATGDLAFALHANRHG